ncbi:MAG TPA: Clp protease N-terminal domain-containing protein [Solirubrobacteraceae bacterium]|jgi:hypothetical protein|nr:Clp protease N-terminal domain-containing protein [Solirubrobacteraceae bacterium]
MNESDYHPWATAFDAGQEARRRGDRKTGTEHLALALLAEPELASVVGCGLERARETLDALDREALAAIGVDATLDAPPLATLPRGDRPLRPSIRTLLRGRLRLTPAAKTVLRDSSKSMRRGHPHPGPQCVLARLLELQPPDPAAGLFAAIRIDRARVHQQLSDA